MQIQAEIPRTTSEPPQSKGPATFVPRAGWPSVAELSARLYGAYQVDGGSVRLAGCTLEPQAIIEITGDSLRTESDDSGLNSSNSQTISAFITWSGQWIDEPTAAKLGLTDLTVCEKPPRVSPAEQARWRQVAREVLGEMCQKRGRQLVDGSTTERIIWCRRAAGKLRFTIGGESVDQPFDDWAAKLAPPPYVCGLTGRSTFHLATTSDGRIAAAEEIVECEETSRRVLRQELVTCSATGKKVASDLAVRCPVTMRQVLKKHLTACPVCLMQVSPAALTAGRCRACANMVSVRKDDPRLCLVFGECPGLDKWHSWRMAETQESYVLEAAGLLRRLLVVIDKRTLAPIRVAERVRFQAGWTDVARERWPEILE